MSATEWTQLNLAHQALRAAVAGTGEAGWARPTPCAQWNAAQVLRHAAGDQLAYAAVITGSGGPAENPFTPAGDAPGQPSAFVDAALRSAEHALATVSPDAEQVPVPLPQGPLPACLAVGAAALDAAVHAWDIAVAAGQPSPLTPDLAARLLPVAQAIVEPLRGFAYAPALDPQPGDDPASALLRYLGRDPQWRP
jgi:uncharacterized protein (TIGR03086 family)